MQEEVSGKAVVLIVDGARMSEQVLEKALRAYLDVRKNQFNHFYFHADIDGASFITGLYKDPNGGWSQYLEYPEPDPRTHKLKSITDYEAQSIMSSYKPIKLDMKFIADFPFD